MQRQIPLAHCKKPMVAVLEEPESGLLDAFCAMKGEFLPNCRHESGSYEH